MLTLYLLRHGAHALQGRVLVGRSAVGLSAAGTRQAEALADALARAPIRAVYASPQPRTLTTAGMLAGRLGLAVEVSAELDEVDFGAWTGRPFAELDPLPEWRAYNALRSLHRPPGGESLAEVQARVVRLLGALRERHRDDAVALVSHGDTLRALLLHCLGMPLDFVLRLEIAPGTVSELVLAEGGPQLRSLGWAAGGPLHTSGEADLAGMAGSGDAAPAAEA